MTLPIQKHCQLPITQNEIPSPDTVFLAYAWLSSLIFYSSFLQRRLSWVTGWAQCNNEGNLKWKREAEKENQRQGSVRKTQPDMAAFENGNEPQTKECGQPLEAWEHRDRPSPGASRKAHGSANTSILAQRDLFQISASRNGI